MEKISVLITGRDMEYNKALTTALSQTYKNMFVTCISYDRFLAEEKHFAGKFDVLLTEVYGAVDSGSGEMKTIILSSSISTGERDSDGNLIMFKYQSIKSIGKIIQKEYMGIHYQNAEKRNDNNSLKSIGVISAIEEALSRQVGAILAQALSVLRNQVIYFDLTEFPKEEMIFNYDSGQENSGRRTWDDFIYFAVYGRSEASLWGMEEFVLKDESGAMFFPRTQGRNPFYNLEEDEIRRFYGALKGSWRMDYAVMILPGISYRQWTVAASENDLVIIINDGRRDSVEKSRRIKERLQEEQFSGRLLTLCAGEKWDMRKSNDFAFRWHEDMEGMSFGELQKQDFWKEIMQMAGFIGGGHFE